MLSAQDTDSGDTSDVKFEMTQACYFKYLAIKNILDYIQNKNPNDKR